MKFRKQDTKENQQISYGAISAMMKTTWLTQTFLCHTIWVDESQDKSHWYRKTQHTTIIDETKIDLHPSYLMIKKIMHSDSINNNELIQITRDYTVNLINLAEQFIQIYREYLNNTITEDNLVEQVAIIVPKINKYFFKQSNLPVSPKELHDWAQAHTNLACTIDDFTLYYSKRFMNRWSTENRKQLMNTSIKRYENELENLKKIDPFPDDISI